MVIAEGHLAIIVRSARVGPVVTLVWKGETSVGSSRGPAEGPQAFLAITLLCIG